MKNNKLFLRLQAQATDLWNESKALDYMAQSKKQRERTIKRLEKQVEEMKRTLNKFDGEFKVLREIFLKDKT